VGNCFSLQREHDTALKFFERAIQIDPYFAYAHTLCGHEHVFNENLDKALVCFRSALKVDNRHYNAWYGLGSIFYRQERLELAEYHFRKATEINPNSTVLQCYLGIVLHAQHKGLKTIEAKQILQNACLIDPKNPQVMRRVEYIFSF
jgi:anaphase-promoting complex subunit 3